MFQNGVDALSKIVGAFFVKKLKILSSSDLSENVQILLACGTNTN